jgi:hypothetical protein
VSLSFSGTGATGIGAALLGAHTVLTDQAQILHLTTENMRSAAADINNNTKCESAGGAGGAAGVGAGSDAGEGEGEGAVVKLKSGGSMQVAELDWGDEDQAKQAGSNIKSVIITCRRPMLCVRLTSSPRHICMHA